ncbi:hypothetical protein NDU88_011382 [Pleurodeles waltl]|uniref:Uncharacterized protein n=1 Tax=Pleurodeles waltl TaxID=8319 RepID=A0AAV7R0U0_PLEWA|nr:hypothetical protein NDU88_011382 [Pleurodeles waltl]
MCGITEITEPTQEPRKNVQEKSPSSEQAWGWAKSRAWRRAPESGERGRRAVPRRAERNGPRGRMRALSKPVASPAANLLFTPHLSKSERDDKGSGAVPAGVGKETACAPQAAAEPGLRSAGAGPWTAGGRLPVWQLRASQRGVLCASPRGNMCGFRHSAGVPSASSIMKSGLRLRWPQPARGEEASRRTGRRICQIRGLVWKPEPASRAKWWPATGRDS